METVKETSKMAVYSAKFRTVTKWEKDLKITLKNIRKHLCDKTVLCALY